MGFSASLRSRASFPFLPSQQPRGMLQTPAQEGPSLSRDGIPTLTSGPDLHAGRVTSASSRPGFQWRGSRIGWSGPRSLVPESTGTLAISFYPAPCAIMRSRPTKFCDVDFFLSYKTHLPRSIPGPFLSPHSSWQSQRN